MSLDHVKKARAFHQSFPQYTVTPLARLDGQAARLGLSNLCVKDESYRFGLNAFKVLGGSFAMANYIADETGKDVADCHRRQPWPRRGMGCQQAGPEGRRAHAQGFHQAPLR